MKTPHKLLVITALVFNGLFLQACAPFRVGTVRVGFTPAARIARDKGIEGKFEENQCLPYALALHKKFQAAHIDSKVIVYGYTVLLTRDNGADKSVGHSSPAGFASSHAVVAFNDEGRTYIMDNQSWKPKWVLNGSSLGLAQQFSGMDIDVTGARVLESAKNLRGVVPAGLPKIR